MSTNYRMPAEWEAHRATWIAWPHAETDWPKKFATIDWVYVEIVRALVKSETVEIICKNKEQCNHVSEILATHRVDSKLYNLHIQETNRSWLRDSAPTAVKDENRTLWIKWLFNAWAKYDNYQLDQNVPDLIAKISNLEIIPAMRTDTNEGFVLEGGAIETNGANTLLVTQECLLSDIQCRNPKLTRAGYEYLFKQYLGINKTIWLQGGCEGDDTHGHIDDVARFVSKDTVLLAYEENTAEAFHQVSVANEAILKDSTNADGDQIKVIRLPMPAALYFENDRLPASYANFYITNKVVIVPTFNDANDRVALDIISKYFPDRQVIGIHAVDLVLGYGTLHCLTQQEPK